MKVYNYSKMQVERARKSQCPRCKGHGSTMGDNGDDCYLCAGHGTLWASNSGFTRPINARLESSELY